MHRFLAERGHLVVLSLLLFVSLLTFGVTHAANVNLTWTHDQTTCADGSAGANCPTSGFELYRGSSDTATDFVRVANGISSTTRAHVLSNVAAGRSCYYLLALGPGGASPKSNIACIDVPFLPPKAPSGVTVTVQISVAMDGSEPKIEVKTAQLQ